MKRPDRSYLILKLCCLVLCPALLLCACSRPPSSSSQSTAYTAGEDPYAGQWDDTRASATLDITVDDEGVYHGMATWTRATDEVSFWEFTARAAGDKLVIEDCSREDVIYDDINGDSDEIVYEGATGSVVSKDGTLSWRMDSDADTAAWVFSPAS